MNTTLLVKELRDNHLLSRTLVSTSGVLKVFRFSAQLRLLCCLALMGACSAAAANFAAALVARTNITLTDAVLVDSFDSGDPNYSTNGQYTPDRRKDGGDIVVTGTNLGTAILLDAALVYGKARIGYGDTISLLSNASLGGTNWVPSPGIQTNWAIQYPRRVVANAPDPPPGSSLPPMTNNFVSGTNYPNSICLNNHDFIDLSGRALSLQNSESIIVQGNVNVYFPEGFSMSGQSFIYITPNSSLTIYSGGDVNLSGGGVVNGTGYATNVTLYGSSSCTSISYSGGSDFIGTVYAPYASFSMTGGGNTIFNLVGSVVADSININGKYRIHCDEQVTLQLYCTEAANLVSPAMPSSGSLSFEVAGVPGFHYAVEASTNLVDWRRVTTNVSPFTFADPGADTPQRFYRAVYLP